MNDDRQRDRRQKGMDWVAAIAGVLLLISLGFELLAHQFFGRTSIEMLLLALYLGFWLYVVGLAFLLVLVVQWLLTWDRLSIGGSGFFCSTQTAPVDQPVQQGTQFHAMDTVLVGPSPRSIANHEEDPPNQLPKAS